MVSPFSCLLNIVANLSWPFCLTKLLLLASYRLLLKSLPLLIWLPPDPLLLFIWAPSSEFVSSSIPSWQTLTAHAQPFRGARGLAFCLKVPLDPLLVWASSEGSGETARMRRLAWTFAARIGDKYQIRLTRSIWYLWAVKYSWSQSEYWHIYQGQRDTLACASTKSVFKTNIQLDKDLKAATN